MKYAKIINGKVDSVALQPPMIPDATWVEPSRPNIPDPNYDGEDDTPLIPDPNWIKPKRLMIRDDSYIEVADDVFGGFTANADGTFTSTHVEPTLDEHKSLAKEAVVVFASAIGAQLTDGYPMVEREAWVTKLAEAKAIVAGETNPANYPVIAAEISVTGKGASEVAPVIILKANLFEKASGLISGIRQKTFSAIDAAADEPEIDVAINTAREEAQIALAALLNE